MHGSDDPLSFLQICYSWYLGTVVMVGSWPREVLPTFAFVAKPYALLWATVLFMHCSCMLIDLFGYLPILFVVGSVPCSERFFSGCSCFPLSSKTNISKFQFDQKSGGRRTTLWMCYLQIVIYFIYLFIYWTKCCTQFKPFGDKTFCFRNFHII